MAQHLARIHGTEEDKVNCPFYFKIGACRHSDRCSRLHHKPTFSPTLLIKHLWQNPKPETPPEQAQEDFLCFYEDLYSEFCKFGRIEELHVVENLGDHLIGHVYIKFADEEQAADALQVMNGRYYDGRILTCEFSPVTDFREARCRDYDEDVCARGGFCNFLHAKPVPLCLIHSLQDDWEREQRRERSDRHRKRKKHDDRHHRSKRHRRSSRRTDSDSDDDRSYSTSPN